MKRFLALLLASLLLMSLALTGCKKDDTKEGSNKTDDTQQPPKKLRKLQRK